MGGQRLRQLRRDIPQSSQYLDAVMERIRQASLRFDGSGEALVNATWKQYADGTPILGLWVAVDTAGAIVGHALGDIQFWSGRTVAWISQVVVDSPAVGKDNPQLEDEFLTSLRQWIEEVNGWAKKHNQPWQVSELIMMSPRMTDAWARRAGFEEYRRVYRHIIRP